MYEKYYKFSGMPFQLTPDSRFFFRSREHQRAIAHLHYGLAQNEGFVIITGEVGAGKTTLVELLMLELDPAIYTISRISTTQVSGDDLLRLAVSGFGVSADIADKAVLLRQFETKLREQRAAGRHCLLIVDEAQSLSLAALEELRMLSNLTDNGAAGLQTILLGQPQFRHRMGNPDFDQLRQRVLASYHLEPLDREETRAYVEHRLRRVDWTGNPSWTEGAMDAVYEHSGGTPRRINRLCSRALLHGALDERSDIDAELVEVTAAELNDDLRGPNGAEPLHLTNGHDHGAASELLVRVEALERLVGQREALFRRLRELISVSADSTKVGL